MICEIFKAIVASAFTIAVCHDAASFVDDLAPSLTSFFDESRSAGSFIVKNDFIAAANRAAETCANFHEVNLKHMAESAIQGVAERFPRLAVGRWSDD